MGAPTQLEFCLSADGVSSEYTWVKEIGGGGEKWPFAVLCTLFMFEERRKAQLPNLWLKSLFSGVIRCYPTVFHVIVKNCYLILLYMEWTVLKKCSEEKLSILNQWDTLIYFFCMLSVHKWRSKQKCLQKFLCMQSLQFEKHFQHNHPSNVCEETKLVKHEKENP